ncbi:MAG: hypothetical protein HY512_00775 [Candidatus Aenigmarchaeota archaeon]|nr:hypothetical protein [Candidatus Aenigmarchaeota archaeon]
MSDDLSISYRSNRLDRSRQRGSGCSGFLVALAAMPVCAYAGSYLGEGIGYIFGNIVDLIPYARDVAPWVAERAGLISDAIYVVDFNENLYQTSGAAAGFWCGLWFPWEVLNDLD